jgi:hypothetical protein
MPVTYYVQQLAFAGPADAPEITAKFLPCSVLPESALLVGKLHLVMTPAD